MNENLEKIERESLRIHAVADMQEKQQRRNEMSEQANTQTNNTETNDRPRVATCYLSRGRQVEGPAELVSAYINAQQRVSNLKNNLALAVEALREAGLPNPCKKPEQTQQTQTTRPVEDDMPF